MRKQAQVIAPEKRTTIKLDKKDKEIINILTYNSRTPLSQIAKYLKTSTEVVHYHYKKLRNQNIITDTFAVIDPKVLGIKRYIVYLQLHALSQSKMKDIISSFLKHKHINWVIESGGKWEIAIMVETLYEEKFDSILESIISPLQNYLNDYMVVIEKRMVHKSPRFIKGLKTQDTYRKIRFPYAKEFSSKKKIPIDIDQKDIALLQLIHKDARRSLTDLGKEIGVSKDAVQYRIKKLIRSKVITGFIIRLNYHLLNYQYTTIMVKLRSISTKRKEEFLHYLYEDSRFFTLIEQIGTWDLSLMMFFTDAKDLRDFLIGIKEKFSDVIHSHESVIHFDQYYYSYLCDGVARELKEKYKKK